MSKKPIFCLIVMCLVLPRLMGCRRSNSDQISIFRATAKDAALTDDLLGRTVQLEGLAQARKGGPFLLCPSNAIEVLGLEAWPHDVEDKQVAVEGVLGKRIVKPENDGSLPAQRVGPGEWYTITLSKWSAVEKK